MLFMALIENEADMGIEVTVSPSGRMSIPADVRKRLGLEKGGKLILNVDENGMTLTTGAQRVRRAQALYKEIMKGKQDETVDDFLKQKRADAAREWAELERDP
jgi:AbrB family looped-hinge helix DNA binding protein